MTKFDWQKFFTRHRLPYVSHGPNTAKNNLSIKCPWCGSSDPSEHLGVSLSITNPVWGCLRNARHRGRSPIRLVAKLLRLSYAAAQDIVIKDVPFVDDYDAAIERLRNGVEQKPISKQRPEVRYPTTFRHVLEGPYSAKFRDYLAYRGFHDVQDLAESYDLLYCLTGDFAWRLIFPVTDDDRLIGWTGRDIRKQVTMRYRASDDLGKDVLLTFDHEVRKVVVVVEGPLDALKIDYYGLPFNISGVATMGTAVTSKQKVLLRKVARVHPTHVVFDDGAMAEGMALAEEIGATWTSLPCDIEDPGAMTQKNIVPFLKRL